MEQINSLKINDYKTVRDAAFEKLKNGILKGYFKPGERLIESQIAEEMGISRTPIREALRRLETQKLVVNLPRKGVMVAPIDESEVREIFNIRGALEGLAVKLAIDNINQKIIDEMESILNEMAKAIEKDDLNKQVECNTRFHDCIINTADSPVLAGMLQNIHDHIQRFRVRSLSVKGRPETALAEHKIILNAVKNGDKSSAERAIQKHIEDAGKVLFKKIQKKKEKNLLST